MFNFILIFFIRSSDLKIAYSSSDTIVFESVIKSLTTDIISLRVGNPNIFDIIL